MKRRTVFLLFSFFGLGYLGLGRVYALNILPTISTVCEDRIGNLRSYNDGFSLFKNCSGQSRRIVLIGSQGPKGDSGPLGTPGAQGTTGATGLIGLTGAVGPTGATGPEGAVGPKGDQGNPGFAADKFVNVCFNVPTGAIRVLRAGTCFPDIRWKIPVVCVPGEPCKPDNLSDSYYITNN